MHFAAVVCREAKRTYAMQFVSRTANCRPFLSKKRDVYQRLVLPNALISQINTYVRLTQTSEMSKDFSPSFFYNF